VKGLKNKIQKIVFFPAWVVLLVGYFAWNFLQMILLEIKRTKIAQKIIYSNFVQACKNRITHRLKILK